MNVPAPRPAIIAHGAGAAGDLGVSLPVLVWALGIAAAVWFAALVGFRPEPKLRDLAGGRLLGRCPTVLAVGASAAGVALFGLSLAAGWVGENIVIRNVLPVTLYVAVWIGGLLAAGLLGDLWAALNPFRSIVAVIDRRPHGRSAEQLGPDWGLWPATVGVVVFLFYELSHPTGSEPRTLAVLLTTHLVGVVVATAAWGRVWVLENEPFTALFRLVGAMGPLFGDGRDLRLRPPLAGLAVMAAPPGSAALLSTVIGGTLFDGFSETSAGRALFADLEGWTFSIAEFAGMVVTIVAVAGLYGLGVWWTARVTDLARSEATTTFAPSLVPIVVGYTVSHYAGLFADNIQVFVFRLADPFGWGWNIGGVADNLIWQIDPDVTAWVRVVAIVVGVIGAVTVAHDIAVARFPGRLATRSLLAMVFVMIVFGALGLWLLPPS